MKKICLIILMALLCLSFSALAKDLSIQKAVKLLSNCPDKTAYNYLIGNNPLKKHFIIEFEDMSTFGFAYQGFVSLVKLIDDKPNVFINNKYKGASSEVLATILAPRAFNYDDKDSKNEEIYCWLYEAYVWKYLTKNKSVDKENPIFLEREEAIQKLIDKEPQNATYLIKYIKQHPAYSRLDDESIGFSNAEFQTKMKHLLKLYNEI